MMTSWRYLFVLIVVFLLSGEIVSIVESVSLRQHHSVEETQRGPASDVKGIGTFLAIYRGDRKRREILSERTREPTTVNVDVSVPPTSPLKPPETKHLKYTLDAELLKGAMMPSTSTLDFDMKTSAQKKGVNVVLSPPAEDEPKPGPFQDARVLADVHPAHHITDEIRRIKMPGTDRLYGLSLLDD